MVVNYTHSRAALLCFGGWGLQVMFHLLPRLQAAQEQRAALHALGPDLNRITRFGAVMPDVVLDDQGQVRFQLFAPALAPPLPPFHLERLLASLDEDKPSAGFPPRLDRALTAAERRAVRLQRAVQPHLRPLTYGGAPFAAPATGLTIPAAGVNGASATDLRRATRAEIFAAGLEHADHAARLLETHVFDAIRQDNLAPDDPFVQTTLYVVAPLFEPLASALLWPILAQLMARLGRRHISQVVALFAAGSYADDLTKPVEDAGAYIALNELEALSGLHPSGEQTAALAARVGRANPALAAYVGEPIFDHVYLLDREKSNQGLAEDSHELAILAGNALEALIVASGDLFIQEQLGLGLRLAEGRPYSLIGAAGDYVPVTSILHAVNRQEESRLVREWILRSTPTPTPAAGDASTPAPTARTLADLGMSRRAALSQLTQRLPTLFASTTPADVDELMARREFVLPEAVAARLRDVAPAEWPPAFDAHLAEVVRYVDLTTGAQAFDEALGLTRPAAPPGAVAPRPAGPVTVIRELAPQALDDRFVPAIIARIHDELLSQLAASPAGLTQAHAQSQRWLEEVEEARRQVELRTAPGKRELEGVQQALARQEWQVRYERALGRTPALTTVLLRAALATALVAAVALAYLAAVGRAWDMAVDGLALLGFATGALLAGLITHRVTSTRLTRLRRERVRQAQAEVTLRLRAQAADGLLRAYDHLADLLRSWAHMLGEAMEELHSLSTPPVMPAVPPPKVPQSYLYRPHLSQTIWDRALAFLRTQQDAGGRRSEERLDTLWGQAEWRQQMTALCTRILRGPGHQPAGAGEPAQTIAEFIRHTVRESVAPVTLQEPSPARDELIRALARDFSIEHLLWRRVEDARAIERRLQAMNVATGRELATLAPGEGPNRTNGQGAIGDRRRYVEAAWNRAKPTGNYDVSDRLAVYGIAVDFAASSMAPGSDLTRSLLEEFSLTLLPTENPFSVLFVRTIHGLGMDDLDSMRRYQAEFAILKPHQRALLLLDDDLR